MLVLYSSDFITRQSFKDPSHLFGNLKMDRDKLESQTNILNQGKYSQF